MLSFTSIAIELLTFILQSRSRWRKAEGKKFGNDLYSVEFESDDKNDVPLFGAKYNFHLDGVVDCPEFLVHVPTLEKLALKFGLKLERFER